MAYQSSAAALQKCLDMGIAGIPSTGAGITGGNSIFKYCSSHGAGDITGAGFLTGVGAQPLNSSGPVPYESIARSTNIVGARPGDVVLNIESSAGAVPGRCTLHAITASTLNNGGYDCTLSAAATT